MKHRCLPFFLTCCLLISSILPVSAQGAASPTDPTLHYASDYEEVFTALCATSFSYVNDGFYEDSDAVFKEVGAATADTTVIDTNLREKGVNEPDTIKTDGSFLYLLQEDDAICVVDLRGEEPAALTRLSPRDEISAPHSQVEGFFLQKDRLFVLMDSYDYDKGSEVTLLTYDVADPSSPHLFSKIGQDGSYLQARMTGDILSLVSCYTPQDWTDARTPEEFIPKAKDSLIPAEKICIPQTLNAFSLTVITTLDVRAPEDFLDMNAVLSGGTDLYASPDNLYLMNLDWSSEVTSTEIIKIACKDGDLLARCSGLVRGSLNDSFSVDEYKGCLRVLTTYTGSFGNSWVTTLLSSFSGSRDHWTRHNALYLLDEEMKTTGILKGMAKDEEIKSARFLGDTVYFVTFQTTDPLFTADLSDPSHPVLTGELFLTGFSSYLHPFGEGRLAGLGYEADTGGQITGIKLSLFDGSSPQAVTETSRLVLDGVTSLPALNDYRTIYANEDRALLGFYLNTHYLLFSLEADHIATALCYDLFSDGIYRGESARWYGGIRPRGVSAGDTFYVAGEGFVTAFDLNTMEELSHVTL